MPWQANVDLYLEGTDSRCYTYDDLPPILEVRTAAAVLSLTAPDPRVVTGDAMVAAQGLLTAVRQYGFALGRLYAEQNGIPLAHIIGPSVSGEAVDRDVWAR